jgi:serine protease
MAKAPVLRRSGLALATGVSSLLLTAGLLAGCAGADDARKPEAPEASSAARLDIPGRIIVDFRDDVPEADIKSILTGALGLSFSPTALEAETREEIAEVDEASEASVLDRLNHDPRVEYAEPLSLVSASFVPNDPLLKEQWHLARIGAPAAWAFSRGRGVTVAVVDTGIACEDFGEFTKGTDLAQTTCVEGFNFVNNTKHANDDQGHGTHVAGTIAQSTNNGIGAAGVAFEAKLMPVKVLDGRGSGTTAAVADGIRWAADHGAQVINLSLGGPRPAQVLQKAIDHARKKGAVVVAAAGNSGGSVGYPGASEGVIGVSATGPDDKLASFSSRGDGVDIAAPGVDVIQQTICNGGRGKCERYPAFSGTSMASPHVAGVAAMLVSMGVTDPAKVEATLKKTARVVDPSEGGKKLYGAGILDAAAATKSVARSHAIVRFLSLGAMMAWAFLGARKVNKAASLFKPGFLAAALLTGPGLLFLAPWLSPFHSAALDLLSRPLGDADLMLGAGLHGFMPLANLAVPVVAAALFFGVEKLRPALAGLALGTASYLAGSAILGESAGLLGASAMAAVAGAQAVGCALLGRFLLSQEK